jgi:hypothetical protein
MVTRFVSHNEIFSNFVVQIDSKNVSFLTQRVLKP